MDTLSRQIYSQKFQSSFTENHDVNEFSILEPGDNIVYILWRYKQSSSWDYFVLHEYIVCMPIKLDIFINPTVYKELGNCIVYFWNDNSNQATEIWNILCYISL